jgi:hypothetical protein
MPAVVIDQRGKVLVRLAVAIRLSGALDSTLATLALIKWSFAAVSINFDATEAGRMT